MFLTDILCLLQKYLGRTLQLRTCHAIRLLMLVMFCMLMCFFLHAALLKLYICVILDVKSNICWWTPWITKTYHNGSSKGYGSVCWTQMKKHVFTLGAESNSWCSSHFMNGTGNLVGIWMQLNNVQWSISRKYMDGKSLFQAPLNS